MRREIHPRVRRCRIEVLALLCLPLLACLKPESTTCPSGRICAPGLKCAARQDACIENDCGDNILQAGEACDDGNIQDGDGCSRTCASNETCGNGETDTLLGEVCDDGNIRNGDGCSSDCQSVEGCGNGRVEPGEQCDDGNDSDNDNCVACSVARCGDRHVNESGVLREDCDAQGESRTCNINCTAARCGDGIVNAAAGEQCDDGNEDSEDGCVECHVATCGDGRTNRNGTHKEECDDGAETATCNLDCTVRECGDLIVNATAGEQCDDGNEDNEDGCVECLVATCGDGRTNRNGTRKEECDTGGESESCDLDCTVSECGDRVVNATAGEQCDDGNSDDDDGCLSSCRLPQCGDGVRTGQEQCDDGNSLACGTCNALCTQAQRLRSARGLIRAVEAESIRNGETFSIDDGTDTLAFGFRKPPDNPTEPVADVEIPITANQSSAAVAREIATAINSLNGLRIRAYFMDGTSTVLLVHEQPGSSGNNALAESVNAEDFRVEGMEDGGGEGCPRGTGCRRNEDCAGGLRCSNNQCR